MEDEPPVDLPRSGPYATTGMVIGRRQFLILTGSAAAYSVLHPRLGWARRLPAGTVSLQPWSLPGEAGGSSSDIARALIGAAVLAPSHWNTQPWRFESEQNAIRVVSDFQRWMPVADPEQRNLYLSLGAALENLLIAARAYGLRPGATYLPHDGAGGVAAQVTWTPGDRPRDRTLFEAIPARRTNRHDYDGRGIYLQNRAQLTAQMADDSQLHWIDDRDRIHAIADLVHDTVRDRIRDARAQAERYRWMRFEDADARERGDGITLEALDMGGVSRLLAGRYFKPGSWLLRFGAESAAKQARSQVRSAGALALLTVPRGGRAQWLAAGQAYERLSLTATALGIAQQPISEPLETEAGRVETRDRFGVGGEQPLMLLRLGHARPPKPSVRRSVALVASFRTS
jgi:nitroreductase